MRIDVSYSYWSHKRAWRVRAWQSPPDHDRFGMGRILSEEFKRTESAAKKAAETLARQFGVTAQRF